MNILVAISSVPDTTSKINFSPDGSHFDTNGIQWVINPYDEFALTRAVWFQEKNGANITIVTVGDAQVEPVMRKALAIGANQAIRVDKNPISAQEVAEEIVSLYKDGEYDLLLLGKESIDYNGGAVGGLVAALLDLPFINNCIGLEIENGQAKALMDSDEGKMSLSASCPLVVAGQKGLVEEADLKIPNMRGIMQARSKPLEVKASVSHAPEVSYSFSKPEPRSTVKFVDKDNLDELVRLLHEEAKVI